jgi:hypothetical protein
MTPYDAPKGYGVGNQANLPNQPTAGQKQPIKSGVGMGKQDACGVQPGPVGYGMGNAATFSGGRTDKVVYTHNRKNHQGA